MKTKNDRKILACFPSGSKLGSGLLRFFAFAALGLALFALPQAASAQTPTVVATGGANAGTHNFSTYNLENFPDLSDATAITVTGTWLEYQMTALRYALHNSSAENISIVNAALVNANLSGVTLSGGFALMSGRGMSRLFTSCTALTQVILPVTVNPLIQVSFESTFYGCTNLTLVTNLEKFTNISNLSSAFSGCTSLPSVTLPAGSSATSVSFSSAFSFCTNLTSVTNLEKFTNISNLSGAFFYCTSLPSVTLPAGSSATSVAFTMAFGTCPNLTSVTNLEKFTNISDLSSAFSGCTSLPSVTLPAGSSATSVSFLNTFSNCTNLTLVTNLEKFTNISDLKQAFMNCSSLPSVTLPAGSSATSVSFSYAFNNCTKLTSINNLEEFTNISSLSNTFRGCSSLPSVTFSDQPNNIEMICQYAFHGCTNLTSITYFEKFTNIRYLDYAFMNCSSLPRVTLPEGTTYTGAISFSSTFYNCHVLTEIENLEYFTNIDNLSQTFDACHLLTWVKLSSIPTAGDRTHTFFLANPNMLKYLPKDSDIPEEWANDNNFINGNKASDNPVAYDDIILVDNYRYYFNQIIIELIAPYHCPLAFNIPAGHRAVYTRNFTGKFWDESSAGNTYQTITLPFDATIEGKTYADFCESDYGVWTYYGTNENFSLRIDYSQTGIEANKPHLLVLRESRFSNNIVTFVSDDDDINIPVSPGPSGLTAEDQVDYWSFPYEGNFVGSRYTNIDYYLVNDEAGDTFVAAYSLNRAVGTESQPFRAVFPVEDIQDLSDIDWMNTLYLPPCETCPPEVFWVGAGKGAANPQPTEANKNLWSVAANWIGNALPGPDDRVVYRSDAIDLHVNDNCAASSIHNATAAGLVILPGQSLVLSGSPDANPTVNFTGGGAITVRAEKNGEPNGTFLVPEGTQVSAKVEFSTKAKSADVSLVSRMKWQYFGIPVASFPAVEMYGAWIREFSHTETGSGADGTTYTYWNWLTNSSVMSPVTGYEISVPASHGGLFTFSGNLITSDQSRVINYDTGDRFAGQWVVSNPFTAGLDIATDLEFGEGFHGEIHFFHTGSSEDWDSADGNEGNAPGQYTVFTQNSSGGIIPSMQGFVVSLDPDVVNNGENNSLMMRYPSAARNATLRASKSEPKAFTDISLLSGGKLKDRMQVYVHTRTTRGYDKGYDGHKLFASDKLSQLYSEEEGEKYQINAVPELDGTYLSVKAQEGIRDYTLRFTNTNLEGLYESITLTDLSTGSTADITAGGEYRFEADNELAAERRFVIGTKAADATTGLRDDFGGGLRVYRLDDGWYIGNACGEGVEITLYTVSGLEVLRRELAADSELRIKSSDYPQGVYIVRFRGETEKESSRKITL